jgi:hypothetical protein
METTPSPTMPKARFHHSPSGRPAIQGIELSHLSIEVGHFYINDLLTSDDRVRSQFERVAPHVRHAERMAVAGRSEARVSTCFLIDDYFDSDSSPREVLGRVLPLAAEAGLRIDYLGREAGCAEQAACGLRPADLVAMRVQPEPKPDSNGSQPLVSRTGWLANGAREVEEALGPMQVRKWRPPKEFAAHRHSNYLEAQLWKLVEGDGQPDREWSCPLLAAVWHLLRLGMLRDGDGALIVEPEPHESGSEWPENWSSMPVVVQLNPDAKPFTAYRAVSVLPQAFLPVEHTVRMILDHVRIEDPVLRSLARRAAGEGIELPAVVADRLTHAFIEA